MILDEFPSLGTMPNLEQFLTRGRKYGVCAVLGFQHIAHVQDLYGRRANAILGQCLHKSYFKVNDAEMAQWCASQFGRLLMYNDDGSVERNDPASTENDFIHMKAATMETGFECVLQSDPSVLPGPLKIRVPARKDLVERDSAVTGRKTRRGNDGPQDTGFVPWDIELELKPWTVEERKELFKTVDDESTAPQSEAVGVAFPVNPLFHTLNAASLA